MNKVRHSAPTEQPKPHILFLKGNITENNPYYRLQRVISTNYSPHQVSRLPGPILGSAPKDALSASYLGLQQ